jgi:inner membrane transporter RhtA
VTTSSRAAPSTRRRPAIPPTGLVLIGIASVQLGSALAKDLFQSLGPGGTAFLRVALAACVLIAVWRPTFRGQGARAIGLAALFGLVTAGMNFSFYESLDRIPLGIAVTIEFCGPLGVAIAGSRRAIDLLFILLAAAGIVLLAPWGGIHLDVLGAFLALVAGACWAAYIYLSQAVGRVFPGGGGLALAMAVGGLALLPVGVAGAGANLLQPHLLLGALTVSLLSSVIPYSCEIEALRSLPARVFGVLMSLEPAVAAIAGFLILHEVLGPRTVTAILLVTAASIGATRTGTSPAPID